MLYLVSIQFIIKNHKNRENRPHKLQLSQRFRYDIEV